MSLVASMAFSSGRVLITAGAGVVPDYFDQGVGFMSDGSLAIDTDAPAGDVYRAGIRQSADGAIYGTVTPTPDDVWIAGIRVTPAGQIVYEDAAATSYNNGNPVTANGRFATIE